MRNELNVLLDQLRQLRIQETRIIEQIEALNLRHQAEEADDDDDSTGLAITALHIGDRVSFDGTGKTAPGTGHVIGFTKGEQPFVRIERDDGKGPREIKRKIHTIHRIS